MVLLKVWFFLLDFFVSKTFAHNVLFCNLVIRSTIMFVSWRVIQSVILPSGALQGLCRAGFFLYGLSQPLRQRLLMTNPILLPPFPKSRNTWPQSTVTGLLWTFLRMTTGLRGGICRKRTSPIKHSYFFGTEEVIVQHFWVCNEQRALITFVNVAFRNILQGQAGRRENVIITCLTAKLRGAPMVFDN